MNSSTPISARGATKIPLWETLPVFFRNAAEPIRAWLQNPDVIEICVNRPGEVWVEALGKPAMERFEVPRADARRPFGDWPNMLPRSRNSR